MPAQPIDIYFWPTPNCWKVTIFCEEADIPYKVIPTNILDGAQAGTVGPILRQAHHVRTYGAERIPYAIDRYTDEAANIYRVLEAIKNRPAVRRGIDVGTDLRTEGLTAEQQRIVFGKRDDVDGPS